MGIQTRRRDFLKYTAGLAGLAALGPLGRPIAAAAQAAGAPVQVAEVDRLDIRVVIDASHDIFQRPRTIAGVTATPIGNPGGAFRVLHNQWGLSLWVESQAAEEKRTVLIDFGYTPEALINNLDIIGLDPALIEAAVVSHGHYDHFGGLEGLVEAYQRILRPGLRLYAGGEDVFCLRVGSSNQLTDSGAIDRRILEQYGVEVVLATEPALVADHGFTSGEIERRTSEVVLGNGQVFFGTREDGLGCDASSYAEAGELGEVVRDTHRHEHATSYNVRDRGLVVVTSCGHSGIVNSALQARDASGVGKVHALVGGFHLGPAEPDYLRQVLGEIRALDPDVIIPMHCSGANFVQAIREEMPDKLLESSTGNLFTFGAA